VDLARYARNMIRLSTNLSPKHRLEIKIIKRRKKLDEPPFFPDLGKVFRAKKGSKISRFFRLLFESDRVKKLLGANLAALVIISSFLPKTTDANTLGDGDETTAPIILSTEHGVQYPVEPVKINQRYSFFHPAIDFGGNLGQTIHPIMAGIVIEAGYTPIGYGNVILISHGNDITSLYAHLSKIEVKVGDVVDNDSEIGLIGTTGHATGPHLHLEIRDHGIPINPLSVLPR
jgi:murein DD-endopeptidase MepM/ murein hydrolase activator NlpD